MQVIFFLLFFLIMPLHANSTLHYPHASKNKEVQALFDKGMLNYYAYLYVQAEYDFRQALLQDPKCGLCYFGLAIAKKQQALELGLPFAKLGFTDIQKAVKRIEPANEFYSDVIQAAKQSFSLKSSISSHQLQYRYIQALKKLYDKYKDNETWKEESLALYVDAIAYYSNASTNECSHCSWVLNEDLKQEAISLLKPVLSDNKAFDHPGLIHTYIHMTERNLDDPLGEILAKKLPSFSHGLIAHYTHMPNHIYWRRGMYDKAIQANKDAIAIDKNYFKHKGVGLNSYYYEYHYLHSYHFLAILGVLTNNFSLAIENAQAVKNLMDASRIEGIKDYRDIFFSLEHLVLLRFNKWQEVLHLKMPAQTGDLGKLLIHFAKALAYLNLNQSIEFQQLFEKIQNEHYKHANLQELQSLALTYLQATQMNIQKKSLDEMENLF